VVGVEFSGINEEKHRILKNPSGWPKKKVMLMMYE